jgi:hypothetical protein
MCSYVAFTYLVLQVDEQLANSKWTQIATVTFTDLWPPSPAGRHLFNLINPVIATGIRIIVDTDIVIDEIEIYGSEGNPKC